MTHKPFNPGDDVAVVEVNRWTDRKSIVWRGKVKKVYKTGAVVTEYGKYRANGSSYADSARFSSRPYLEHFTPELLAEVERGVAERRAEYTLFGFADTLRKLRGEDALAMAEKLVGAGVIGGDA